jgi:hypothetical protein
MSGPILGDLSNIRWSGGTLRMEKKIFEYDSYF